MQRPFWILAALSMAGVSAAADDPRPTEADLRYLNALRSDRDGLLIPPPFAPDLEGLAGETTLNLYGSKIDDAGLIHLQGLTNLRLCRRVDRKWSDRVDSLS